MLSKQNRIDKMKTQIKNLKRKNITLKNENESLRKNILGKQTEINQLNENFVKIKKQFENESKKFQYLKQKYFDVVSSVNDIKAQYKKEIEQIIKQFKNI